MTPDEERLSRISTQWSLVFRAHQHASPARNAALEELLHRYGGAVYRYFRSVVRDEDAVEELCQQLAFRLARGDFHRARPDRGRFRNLLKTAIAHLITDWWRQRRAQHQQIDSDLLERLASRAHDPARDFFDRWRSEMIDRAWKRLAGYERERRGRWHYTALRHRVEHPEQSAAELAADLSGQLNRPLTEDSVWQTIHRGREKFAAFLLEEVAATLEDPSPDDLRDEVTELGLQRYCEPALEQRGA